ncbi:MAG: STAS domain-containing protein [Gammaproteobacteria bacterium]|nr:STAS domain-containing protein [Gammaproteobacteria bacterium]MDH5728522.1 STAS domain-containing protein [Gammaproteobacteria bacterium]
MAITSSVGDNGNTVTISINGRFDFNDHTAFRDAYRDASGSAKFVLDMAGTEYMDSSALGMLLLLREHAGGDKADISIAGCKPEIKKILTIANFQKLFNIR